jgi:hypothetical protein
MDKQYKKTLGWACRQHLLDECKDSNYILENASVKEYKLFKEWIKKLTDDQAISVVFEQKYKPDAQGVVGLDDKAKMIARLGVAGALGASAASIFKLHRGKFGQSLALSTGSLIAAVSTTLYAAYKTGKDKCHQKCKPTSTFVGARGQALYSLCYWKCALVTANQVLSQIRSEKGKCSNTPKPDKCRQRIEMLEIKWTRKVRLINDHIKKLQSY